MKEYRFANPEDRTLPRLLSYQANHHGDRDFFQFATEPAYTFGDMDLLTNRVARGFQRLGVGRGDRVLMVLPNSSQFVPIWFGLSKLGAIEVPINFELKGRLLSYLLENCEAEVLVCHARFLDNVARALRERSRYTTLVAVGGSEEDARDTWMPLDRIVTYEELCDNGDGAIEAEVDYTDTISILYTSGTTGPSKGVMSSHHQYYVWSESIAANMGLSPEDTYYHCLPLFYGDAQFMATYFGLVFGSKVTIYDRFSASRYWSEIRECGATATNMLGAMAHILWKLPEQPDDPDNPIRVCNSIPLPPFKKEFEERFGIKLVTGYGQTETNLVAYDTVDEQREGSCGRAGPEYEIAIVDGFDQPVPPRSVGEIVIRPRRPWAMFSGYYGTPDSTVSVWRNLWFHTGDAGYMDEDGWLYFVDRIKDAIRRRGQNISAQELESIINEHPSILESAAVAVPAEFGEDEVKVVVVTKPGDSLAPEQLLDFCQDRMPRFMVPRYVEFRTGRLPRTPSEKIAKDELRREGITPLTWDRESHGYELRRD